MLPESYPDPQFLPFNRTAMRNFTLSAPDRDPGGPGLWLAMQETRILTVTDNPLQLPSGPELTVPLLESAGEPLYLGDWGGVPCRALRLESDFAPDDAYRFENLLAAEPQLDIATLSLAGLAAQALHWQSQSSHCGRCGSLCEYIPGEWGRRCNSCGLLRYPAVHPCVIVLIARADELLLVRKAEWSPQRYSLVAGFVELGESLEECVCREVAEEVGIQIANLRYAGSQSWPFPSQLMAGYFAEYAGGELALDREELEDGGWFARESLPQLPPRRSIARWLIDSWCRQQEGLNL